MKWRADYSRSAVKFIENRNIKSELNQADLKIESYDIQFGEFYGVVTK